MINKGDTFGRLTVIELNTEPPNDIKYKNKITKWHKCICSCENKTIVVLPEHSLINGNTTSCGCYRKEKARKQIIKNRELMKQNGNTTAPKNTIRLLTANGETKSLSEWARIIGISREGLRQRLEKVTLEEAIEMGGRKSGN